MVGTATTILIVHGLVAVALLGGITHQAFAACWPGKDNRYFFSSFRAVRGASYTNALIVLYILSAALGGYLYPVYRLFGRTYLESAHLWEISGTFELKEQFVAIGLGLLPFYWLIWRKPLSERYSGSRAATTAILCFIVWYSFIAGHVINNVRGVFGR